MKLDSDLGVFLLLFLLRFKTSPRGNQEAIRTFPDLSQLLYSFLLVALLHFPCLEVDEFLQNVLTNVSFCFHSLLQDGGFATHLPHYRGFSMHCRSHCFGLIPYLQAPIELYRTHLSEIYCAHCLHGPGQY